jgi:hypothetical protein
MAQIPTYGETTMLPGTSDTNVPSAPSRPTVSTTNVPEAKPGTINWLGSSYTGADIKVVVHLYETPELASYDLTKAYQDAAAMLQDLLTVVQGWRGDTAWQRNYSNSVLAIRDNPSRDPQAKVMVASTFADAWLGTKNDSRPGYIQRLDSQIKFFKTMALQSTEKQDRSEELKTQSSSTIVLESLQTLSIQSHREKMPVRGLGSDYVKSLTRGPRTLAGSMIFTVFNEHPLKPLLRAAAPILARSENRDVYSSTLLPDQLPPLDVTIVFANEYGSVSRMAIYGLEFLNDGVTFSTEDLLSEQVMQFMARDCDIMTSVGKMSLNVYEQGMFQSEVADQPFRGSDLKFTNLNAYNDYLERLGLRNKVRGL